MNDTFCKDIKKDLKRELNFKPSNLRHTIFGSRNGVGLDGKLEILPGWVGISRLSVWYFRVTKTGDPWNVMVKAGARLLEVFQIITYRFLSYRRRYNRFSTVNSYYVLWFAEPRIGQPAHGRVGRATKS